MVAADFVIEEWNDTHPRWQEFIACLEETAPEQAPFVLGEYSRNLACTLIVALQGEAVVGFLRFGIQPIGAETNCPPLVLKGTTLTEAKIHAFAVRPERRNQGIGTALQQSTIEKARASGCYQLTSHSSYERTANFHVKLSLGFCAQPERHGDHMSVLFFMPLWNEG